MKNSGCAWRLFVVSTYTPWTLLCLLAVGCLLLFSLIIVPNSQFNNVPLLFAEHDIKGGPNQGSVKGNPYVESHQLPVEALGMESDGRLLAYSGTYSYEQERTAGLQRDRVAANILIRSGYLKSADVRVETCRSPPPDIFYWFEVAPQIYECADLDVEEGVGPNITDEKQKQDEESRLTAAKLAIVAVAVEKFNRTALHRTMKWAYANTFLSIFDRLPDLSLGPAQIRPSRIRKIAGEIGQQTEPYKELYKVALLPDRELLEALSDECRSLKLATSIMYYFLSKANECNAEHRDEKVKKSSSCPDEDEDASHFAARNYVGQRRTTSAIIDYAPIVAAGAASLDSQSSNCPTEPPAAAAVPSVESPNSTQENPGLAHQKKVISPDGPANKTKLLAKKTKQRAPSSQKPKK